MSINIEGVALRASSSGRAAAEIAAQMLESFIPKDTTPKRATDNSARIIKALIFAGKISQADVDRVAALFA